VILSFRDPATEDLYHGKTSARARRFPSGIHKVAKRKLDMLDSARTMEDLKSPPGNRLEALAGDLQGFHSIRVNDQWRIIFQWSEAGAEQVSLTDYH
jgi:proteic killer suppression protein